MSIPFWVRRGTGPDGPPRRQAAACADADGGELVELAPGVTAAPQKNRSAHTGWFSAGHEIPLDTR